ncbi:hypothetical protein MN0502_06880 [Arthrobacter sp. MN05-02]|nr:hypothetical protein MN0502_06880 [Arthrobacter sp. MN05-02]
MPTRWRGDSAGAVAEDEDVELLLVPMVEEPPGTLQAAMEPARVMAAAEDAKRYQRRRDGEGRKVVMERVKNSFLFRLQPSPVNAL